MIDFDYECYCTVNSGSEVLVSFNSVSHILEGGKDGESSSWIHFHSGKCVHVVESYEVVKEDYVQYLERVRR